MKVQLLALTVVMLVSPSTSPARDAGKKELGKLEGAWQLVRGEANGDAASEYVVANLEVVIQGDQLTFKGIAPLTDQASSLAIKVDTSANPRCIDLRVKTGTLEGAVLEGIYESKDGELKLCLYWARGERNRPVAFDAEAGSNRVLFVLKRRTP